MAPNFINPKNSIPYFALLVSRFQCIMTLYVYLYFFHEANFLS